MKPALLHGLDLNLLVTLHALLTTANEAEAAHTLGHPVDRVQRDLHTLRDVFGDPLLVRSGTSQVPTPTADNLLPELARSLQGIARLPAFGRFEAATSERCFHVAMCDLISTVWLPTLLTLLQHEAPNVRLSVVSPQADLGAMLRAGTVDLALGAPAEGDDLLGQTLGSGPWPWSVVWRGDDAAIDPTQWGEAQHIDVAGTGLFGSPREALERMGLPYRAPLELSHVAGLADLLAQGGTVASLPTPVAHVVARGRNLNVADHPVPTVFTPVRVVQMWHTHRRADAGVAWLAERVFEAGLLHATTPND